MELVALAHQRPEQTLAISPTIVAFSELLRLPVAELAHAIERAVHENPALERIPGSDADALPIEWAATVVDEPSDAARLLADVCLGLPEHDHDLAEYVVASLDERGFLTARVDELARWSGVGPARVEFVLGEVRAVGPPGVGASDLRECLLLQLDRFDGAPPLARRVIEDHLADLAAGRFGSIAVALAVCRDEVIAVRDFVRARLRPAPDYAGQAQSPQQQTVDIVVDERLRVSLTEPARFGVRITALYAEIAERGTAAERRHASAQVRHARAFATRLEQRWETTRAVAQETIARQSRFVRGDRCGLRPLTRAEVANSLGVHESTVSRAMRDRHARLPDGRVVAMSALFHAAASGAREALREVLADEAHRAGSDAELVDALAARGYNVARRTVAKYRAQLGVARRGLR